MEKVISNLPPDKKVVGKKIELIGKLSELLGENPFKVRSYYNAARVLQRLEGDFDELVTTGNIGSIRGIGDALSRKIEDLYSLGTTDILGRLMEKVPDGVIEILEIKGLGPKKIKVLWEELDIKSPGELLYACNENRLTGLKGFGAKSQETIRQKVEYVLLNKNRFNIARIFPKAEALRIQLEELTESGAVEFCGKLSRMSPICDSIELLVHENWKETILAFIEESNIIELDSSSEELIAAEFAEEGFPILVRFSGENFVEDLFRARAAEPFLAEFKSLSGPYKNEEEIFAAHSLSFVPIEMREEARTVDLARSGKVPRLLEEKDLKGSLHNHTTWSDGAHSMQEMAEECIKMGLQYFGVSDHSKSAFYANGLSIDRVLKQHQEIDELNSSLTPFRILKGIESDILFDGSLDYPDEILSTFDFVVSSVHSQLKMEEEKATERLIKAIENPYTKILGHPTGRLLMMRQGYPIDHKKIIDCCADNGVSIELNSNPFRLDIDWTYIPYALSKGVKIAINPDAHRKADLSMVKWGVAVGRKGGLDKEGTLNSLSLTELLDFWGIK